MGKCFQKTRICHKAEEEGAGVEKKREGKVEEKRRGEERGGESKREVGRRKNLYSENLGVLVIYCCVSNHP